MKVSTRVEYGVAALTDIALHSENGSIVPAPEIAKRQGISPKYLEQILTHLKQSGLIRAQKGIRGGYTLARQAENIRMSEVIGALDQSVLEVMNAPGSESAESLRGAVNACLWEKINRAMLDVAEQTTLADLTQECGTRLSAGWDLYII